MIVDLKRTNRKAFNVGFTSTSNISHQAYRNIDIINMIRVPAGSNQAIRFAHEGEYNISDVVVYNSLIYDLGEGRTGGSHDHIGVSVRTNIHNVWIVDNYFHTIGGDAIQLDADRLEYALYAPNHVYIGRNVAHDMFENFLDLKNSRDVIVSQNTAFNIGPEFSIFDSGGAAFRYGGQDQVEGIQVRQDIWTIFNEVFNIDYNDGAFLSYNKGDTEPFSDHIYYIGNIVHNCLNSQGKSTAFGWWYQNKIFLLHNTIWNCNRAANLHGETLFDPPSEQMTIIGNIFGDIVGSATDNVHLLLRGINASLDRALMLNNLFYRSSEGFAVRQGVFIGPGTAYSQYNFSSYVNTFPLRAVNWTEANPLMIDPENHDYRLQIDSPAINASDSEILNEIFDRFQSLYGIDIRKDIEGNPRPLESAPDIGAYEYIPESAGAQQQSIQSYSLFSRITNVLTGKITGRVVSGEDEASRGDGLILLKAAAVVILAFLVVFLIFLDKRGRREIRKLS
jgi:hypothetical protein